MLVMCIRSLLRIFSCSDDVRSVPDSDERSFALMDVRILALVDAVPGYDDVLYWWIKMCMIGL